MYVNTYVINQFDVCMYVCMYIVANVFLFFHNSQTAEHDIKNTYVCMYVWWKHLWKTWNWEIHAKLMIWLLFKRKFKLGKNTSWKPGIEKSMKSCWFDYFSKGNLNWENRPWKTRNWEIHEKLMIWLVLFKWKFKLGKPSVENQELRNPWKVDDLTTVQMEISTGKKHQLKTSNWEIHEHTSIHACMNAYKQTDIRTYIHAYMHRNMHICIHTW